jgi:hypothetical protein
MGVTEWRSKLGDLRQGLDVVVVLYRRKPATLFVPIPPAFWEDSAPFFAQVMQLRDQQLRPPAQESMHSWVQSTYKPTKMTIEDARRGTAKLFGLTMRNTPVILTFYDYDNAIMIPLPADLSEQELETSQQEIQALVESPDTG